MSDLQPSRRDPQLAELFSKRGAVKAVAEGLGISTAAVSRWPIVPAKRRADVARILGVDAEQVPVRQRRNA